METALRFERPQSAAWSHLGRGRGNVDTICEELAKINRVTLAPRADDQQQATTVAFSQALPKLQPVKAEG